MIELYDTSALILAARDADARTALSAALERDEVAISEPILLEYLNGARNEAEYLRFDRALRAAHLVRTSEADWQRALDVHRRLAAMGPGHQRAVRLVDLIVAACAERNALAIVHLDADYERIASITGQPQRRLV